MALADDKSIDVEHGRGLFVSEVSIRERVVFLYEDQREAIYRFLVGQGLPPAVAQEITQDVFVDLFTALKKGELVQAERPWLYKVAAHAAVDYWRREGRSMWVELDSDTRITATSSSRESNPEMRAERQQTLQRIAIELRRLPKEQRMCIHLRMQGLRYREIAKILAVSTSTAAEWLATAIDRLKGNTHA